MATLTPLEKKLRRLERQLEQHRPSSPPAVLRLLDEHDLRDISDPGELVRRYQAALRAAQGVPGE